MKVERQIGRPQEPTIYAALLLCVLAALSEGFDNQSIGVAAPRLIREFGLKPAQFGLVFSAASAGLFFGALLGGRAADMWGRAQTLAVSLLVFGIFSLLTALTPDFTLLLLVRFLTGLGLGGAMPNFITLAAESVPTQRRVAVVALITAAIPLGGAVSGLVALGAGAGWDWRSIFYVGGAAPIIAAIAAPVLSRNVPRLQRLNPAEPNQVPPLIRALFGANATTTSLLWIAFFLTHLVLFSLVNWLPSLSVGLGLAREQSGWAAILFNVGGSTGGALVGVFARINHRTIVVVAYAGTCVALVGLVLMGHLAFGAFAAASFLAGLFTIGGQVTLYGLAPLCYPSTTRGTGVGAALALGRLGAVVGPALIGTLLTIGLSGGSALLWVMPFVAAGGAVAFALATRNHRRCTVCLAQ